MMNMLVERRIIGTQEDGSPLYDLRIVVDNRDIVPTDEQRAAVLLACEVFDEPRNNNAG